jgi:rhodanese-related sulfurtransferase
MLHACPAGGLWWALAAVYTGRHFQSRGTHLMVANLITFATNHFILVAIFFVLLILLLLNEIRRGGQSLSNGQLTALVNADKGVVLDIRTSKEFAAGHIVGALNIPQDKLASRMAELEKHKDKTLIVVDSMGQQSGAHCRELLKAGYTAAKLSGGISSWKADNLPLVK